MILWANKHGEEACLSHMKSEKLKHFLVKKKCQFLMKSFHLGVQITEVCCLAFIRELKSLSCMVRSAEKANFQSHSLPEPHQSHLRIFQSQFGAEKSNQDFLMM